MFETILVPTDGSVHSETAANVGFDLAESLEADVHVLAVANLELAELTATTSPPRHVSELEEAAAEWASELGAAAESRGLETTEAVRTGVPAEEIVEYAAAVDADLVVMGTAGRGGIERALVGSVTDKVVRTAPVPVVTVGPDAEIESLE